MNDIESSPYAVEHSLITKAVRRGNIDLVEKTFNYLINIKGQRGWLVKRLAVIGYEECWQYANTINFKCTDEELLEQYKAFACKVKNKDCDGLAYLANRVNNWENTAIRGDAKQRIGIKKVAEAMKNDTKFWEWIEQQPLYSQRQPRIDAAREATKKSIE